MKKQKIVCASKRVPQRKVIRASKSVDEMLDAFESKLSEFGIDACTDVTGSTEVDVNENDYSEEYRDVGGGFGEPNQIYSVAEMKTYWNENHSGDPVLEEYSSFEDWFKDTKENFLERI